MKFQSSIKRSWQFKRHIGDFGDPGFGQFLQVSNLGVEPLIEYQTLIQLILKVNLMRKIDLDISNWFMKRSDSIKNTFRIWKNIAVEVIFRKFTFELDDDL